MGIGPLGFMYGGASMRGVDHGYVRGLQSGFLVH